MTFIGIDFGDKRIGIAKSGGILATGVCTLNVNGINDAFEKTVAKIEELGGEKVILGLPVNMDGTEGFRAERTRRFAEMIIEKTGLEVVFFDERLTTSQAYTYMNITDFSSKKRRGVIDTLSAQIILQGYIDNINQSK
ncbi:MAG: Holliday junction resolvase RuvX [Clostridia bacterium]